jgi:hypothetical protein
MKLIVLIFSMGSIFGAFNGVSWAEEASVVNANSDSSTTHSNTHPYDQLLMLQMGPYTPRSIAFTNWNNNTFDYTDQAHSTFLAELGWGIELFNTGPVSYFLTESLAYSNSTYKLPASLLSNPGNMSITVHLLGFDTRLQLAWNDLLKGTLTPFLDAGVQYTLYNQSGSSDLVSGEGSAANLAAGLGLRYWVNRSSSVRGDFPGRYMAIPIFLTAKLNKIFTNNSGVDLANTTILGGITVGL